MREDRRERRKVVSENRKILNSRENLEAFVKNRKINRVGESEETVKYRKHNRIGTRQN